MSNLSPVGELLFQTAASVFNSGRRAVRRVFDRNAPDCLKLPWIRRQPKILTHEHLDCSVRPLTLLELWSEIGFEKAATVPFPAELLHAWHAAGNNPRKRRAVADQYQDYVAGFASASLKNYVDCIVWTVLPAMQTATNLYRITNERLEDAATDGVIAMELRFAPQLHTAGGLSLDEVMQAVVSAVENFPVELPVKLIICSLRHEDRAMCKQLVDLAIRYKKHVSKFDLAGDEHANPGVLDWWLEETARLVEHGIGRTVHLWETEEPTAEDLERLENGNINVVGHAIRGKRHGDRIATVCPTSNVVTGQVSHFARHPIDRMFFDGARVTIDTDGTLFTRTCATKEYMLLNRYFGWGNTEFLVCNLTALQQIEMDPAVKQRLRARLLRGYCR